MKSVPVTGRRLGGTFLVRAAMAAALLISLAAAQAQTYLIDFGGDSTTTRGPIPDDPVNYWNNVTGAIGTSDTGVLSNLVSSMNATSTIALRMITRFNGVNEAGTQNSSTYPVDATRDSLYGNTEPFNNASNIFPSFKFTGLDAATKYSFTFFASRTAAADNRETGYTVTGGNNGFAALNASENTDQTATVADITPNASGEITIAIAPTANNDNANHFTYLGVLKLDAVPPQTPLAFTLQPVSQKVVQLKPVTFTAAVSGPPPYFVQWYENNVEIPGANNFSYTIDSVQLNMNGWTYAVSVSNLVYGVRSTNAVLTVNADTNPPTLVKAASYDGSTVEVTFNEPMDSTVFDASSYRVNSGTPGVIAANPSADGVMVTLTLDSPISGTTFTLTVNNLQDVAGNRIANNSSIVGTVVPIEDQDLLMDFGGANQTLHGPSPDDPVNYWNNVGTAVGASDTGVLNNLVTHKNATTPVGLSMIRRFGGANENGTQLATVFPIKATRDSLYGNTEGFSGLTNIFPSFKLTGLNPARLYSLTFYASRTSVSDNRETGYSIRGANTNFVKLNAANNVNNTVRADGVAPTGGGEITISMAPTPANNNANHFTYLGVLKVSPYTPPLRFLPPVIEAGQIKLQWTGSGKLYRSDALNGSWTEVLPTPSSPFSEPVVPGQNRYYRLLKYP